MGRKIILGISIVCFISFAAFAQTEPDVGQAVPSFEDEYYADDTGKGAAEGATSGEGVVSPADIVAPEETGNGNVTLDFREADIRNVLRILSIKSGVNIVPGPEVTGQVTIQLTDVPWEHALQVILETYGYGYDRRNNVIVVTTVENLIKRRENAKLLAEQEPLVSKTFHLNYAKAENVVATIEKMATPRGSVNFDMRTNTVIVRDTPTNLKIIEEIVPTLDETTPQVLIEAKIVETTLSDQENLGIDWTAKATITGAQRPHTWPFSQTSSFRYFPDDFPGASSAAGSTNIDFTYGTLNFNELQAVLQLLKSRTDTEILSNPRIVTLDNQEASITVGQQYPIPTYTYNEEQARLQVSGWEYKDIGILFNVTPHVNNAGFITMDVEPQVTDILELVTVENTELPKLSNEAAKTQVMIKGGETLVIAGLIKDKTIDLNKKIPILGDIPLLGLAFQKKEKTVTKTDMIIFITPHIITADLDIEE